jgi:hypothetical protein
VIRPIVTYASETWVLKETVILKLSVFERKILRRIFGPTKENQIWRVETNKELDKLIFFSVTLRPNAGHGLLIREVSRSHNDALRSVGLLWTSDHLVAETTT